MSGAVDYQVRREIDRVDQTNGYDFRGPPTHQQDFTEYNSSSGERTITDINAAIAEPERHTTVVEHTYIDKDALSAHHKSQWLEEHERWTRVQEQWMSKMQEQNNAQWREWERKRNEQWKQREEDMDSMGQKLQDIEGQLDKDPLRPKQGYRESPPEPDLSSVRHARTVFTAMIEDFSPVW